MPVTSKPDSTDEFREATRIFRKHHDAGSPGHRPAKREMAAIEPGIAWFHMTPLLSPLDIEISLHSKILVDPRRACALPHDQRPGPRDILKPQQELRTSR